MTYPNCNSSAIPTFTLENISLLFMANRVQGTSNAIYFAVLYAHYDHVHGFPIRVLSPFFAAFKTETLDHASVYVCCYEPVSTKAFVFAKFKK